MELTLAIKELKKYKDADGISKIRQKEMLVIDKHTGEELTGKTSVLWGGRELLVERLDESLLTNEHIDGDPDDASYMIIVIRCDKAINL